MRTLTIALGVALILAIGCDTADTDKKIANLEKLNHDLKAEVVKGNATTDYDLQAKCSKDAKIWFKDNWSNDKETRLLNFTNHYNKAQNKCFIVVEYHYSIGVDDSWMNNISLWDIYENVKYGEFGESHMIHFKPPPSTDDRVFDCEVYGTKCKSIDEFNNLTGPYLTN